ncbi:MAG: transketolase C-terminal domain-containing protein [bacterium]
MRKTSLECVYQLAKTDERVIFIGSDLGVGVLDDMRKQFPDRWFMEGISEQHIIGMAAGLALEGFIPYVNTIATFLTRRCYEQLVIDVGLHRLPLRLIGNGGGAVYAPLGPTHQAIEDLAIMRAIPNMTVVAPCDSLEMERLMLATLSWPDPIYIRLAKGGDQVISEKTQDFQIGKGVSFLSPGEVLFVTTGVMTQRAITASNLLSADGISCGVLHMHTIKPLDEEILIKMASNVSTVVTVEEHQRTGGLGTVVLETLSDAGLISPPKVIRLGIGESFSDEYGSQNSLLESWGLDVNALVKAVKEALGD